PAPTPPTRGMGRQRLAHRFGRRRIELLQAAQHGGMQSAPFGMQQAGVGSVLNQGMLEGQHSLRSARTREQQSRLQQSFDVRRQFVDVALGHGSEQADRELTPDDRADLSQGFRRLEMIETARQGSLQRRRYAGIDAGFVFRLPGRRASLDDRPGDLLDEERPAVRPGSDALADGGTEMRSGV